MLFVGHLADRIAGERPFSVSWQPVVQLHTKALEDMQRRLSALGLYKDKIDGKAGMRTRLALGAYQKTNGLKLDCWPTAARARPHAGQGRQLAKKPGSACTAGSKHQ